MVSMTPREILRYHVHALNRHGIRVEMRIVERDNKLILWDGLASHSLTPLLDAWTVPELEAEVVRLTGATRVILV